ncbi:hypothetical protein MKX03_001904 [Papaver bracteatum]|nr:hypothetical protein MKX03_001904 [Papaver bracteatum]
MVVSWTSKFTIYDETVNRRITGFGIQVRAINITVIDDRVIVEGWEGNEAYWVRVWTVDIQNGLITQFREYFNTWITVRDLRMSTGKSVWGQIKQIKPTIWQSEPQEHLNRSLPGLVLAI